EGVHPDASPGSATFSPVEGPGVPWKGGPWAEPDTDQCVREEMSTCSGDDYSFLSFNCCMCVSNSLYACGLSKVGDWPNSPSDATTPPFVPQSEHPIPESPPLMWMPAP